MLLPMLITILGIIWIGYETDWQYRIICIPLEPFFKIQGRICQSESHSVVINTVIANSSDNKSALWWAKREVEHLEHELIGRGTPFGGGFAKSKGKGAIARPYRDMEYEDCQREHDITTWYMTMLQEYVNPEPEITEKETQSWQEYFQWQEQRYESNERRALNYGHYRR